MSFKINDLDKFLKEDPQHEYLFGDATNEDEDDEPSVDVGAELSRFADVPEDIDSEEIEVPAEASNVDDAFELEPTDNGYEVGKNGYYVCNVKIMCDGKVQEIENVLDPSKCTAVISDIGQQGMAEEYKEKLESMGYVVSIER